MPTFNTITRRFAPPVPRFGRGRYAAFPPSGGAPRPFSPASIPTFTAAYAFDRGSRWQNAGNTVAASATNDLVYTIQPYLGTGPDLVTDADANRFLLGTTGLVGNGTKTGYRILGLNLSGAYTFVVRFKCGASTGDYSYAGMWTNTASVGLMLRNNANAAEYYNNANAAVTNMLGTAGQFVTVGFGSAANVGTGYRADGTTVAINGSSGSTPNDANSDFYFGANVFGTKPVDSTREMTDLLIFNGTLTAPQFVQIQNYVAGLRS